MRAPLRTTLSIALAVAVLGIAAAYAAARSPAPQYSTLISRDDKLCTTLRDFYGRHVRDEDSRMKGYIEDQFGREVTSSGVKFLPGFVEPPVSMYASDTIRLISDVDVYNDGSLRTVIIRSDIQTPTRETLNGVLFVLAPNLDDTSPLVQAILNDSSVAFTAAEQWVDFNYGGSSIAAPITTIGESGQYLLEYGGKIYGVARTPLYDTQAPDHVSDNTIDIYSLAHSGTITDVCRLELLSTKRRNAQQR